MILIRKLLFLLGLFFVFIFIGGNLYFIILLLIFFIYVINYSFCLIIVLFDLGMDVLFLVFGLILGKRI